MDCTGSVEGQSESAEGNVVGFWMNVGRDCDGAGRRKGEADEHVPVE